MLFVVIEMEFGKQRFLWLTLIVRGAGALSGCRDGFIEILLDRCLRVDCGESSGDSIHVVLKTAQERDFEDEYFHHRIGKEFSFGTFLGNDRVFDARYVYEVLVDILVVPADLLFEFVFGIDFRSM